MLHIFMFLPLRERMPPPPQTSTSIRGMGISIGGSASSSGPSGKKTVALPPSLLPMHVCLSRGCLVMVSSFLQPSHVFVFCNTSHVKQEDRSDIFSELSHHIQLCQFQILISPTSNVVAHWFTVSPVSFTVLTRSAFVASTPTGDALVSVGMDSSSNLCEMSPAWPVRPLFTRLEPDSLPIRRAVGHRPS